MFKKLKETDVKKKNVSIDAKLTSEDLTTEFNELEKALLADTVHLEKITNEMKVLQDKLKRLVFSMVGQTFTLLKNGDKLGYDFTKRQIVYVDGSTNVTKPLLAAPAKTRKDVYEFYLPSLIKHLRDEFLFKKEMEMETQ